MPKRKIERPSTAGVGDLASYHGTRHSMPRGAIKIIAEASNGWVIVERVDEHGKTAQVPVKQKNLRRWEGDLFCN